jgi:Cof subfamily protein (haloacid dehalogenase superfamily)
MKLKNYLIAIDLDGTVITGFDNYDKKSFRLLKRLAKNNYVVITTGRPLRSSKYYYDLLKLKTPIANYNGALLHHPNDPNFPKTMISIDRNDLFQFIDDNADILETIFCEIEDDIYLYKETDYIYPYLHADGANLTVGDFKDTLHNNPNGAIIFSKLGSEARLINYVENKFQGRIKIRIWYVNTIVVSEFYSPLTSKANALSKICEYYHIPQEKIIAIGDGHNDIEMIEFASYGVAMGNGHPDLLKVAKYHTKSVKEHGVYYFLKNFKRLI